MSQAARDSLATADRTQRTARTVLGLAILVGVVGGLVIVLAVVAGILVVTRDTGAGSVSDAAIMAGFGVVLLVLVGLLAVAARFAQLASADVRASRAYEAAVAGALADLLRRREGPAAAPTSVGSGQAEPVPVAESAAAEPWRPHSHSVDARTVGYAAAVAEPAAEVDPATYGAGAPTWASTAEAVAQTQPAVEPAAATPDPVTYPAVVPEPVTYPPVVPEPTPYPPVVPEPAVQPTAPIAYTPVTPEPAAAVPEPAAYEPEPVAQVAEPVVAQAEQQAGAVIVEPTTGLPIAGWYPDPAGPGQRWWDGLQWTTATR